MPAAELVGPSGDGMTPTPLGLMAGGDFESARRQLEICNACRYCEGLCAVFPALERRTAFEEPDLLFLANLCHDCRACYFVCPFAPPHAWGVNIPKLMAETRERTYKRYAWPAGLGRWLMGNRPLIVATLLVGLVLSFVASLAYAGPGHLADVAIGPGAFYRILPWLWMFVPGMALGIYGVLAVTVGVTRFWRETGGHTRPGWRELTAGIWDALTLHYLDGGGPGCDYPEEAPSSSRSWLHHLVFWGFGAAFVSTTLAFVSQEIFGILPPYPIVSAPVLFGVVGGLAMVIGGLGLLVLKGRADRVPASAATIAVDRAFLATIIALNVTGLALLIARETPAMAVLLDFHLAFVFAFLMTAPYGKFVHGFYRTAALVQDRIEARAEGTAAS